MVQPFYRHTQRLSISSLQRLTQKKRPFDRMGAFIFASPINVFLGQSFLKNCMGLQK